MNDSVGTFGIPEGAQMACSPLCWFLISDF